MPFKFNPFTGKLDLVNASSASSAASINYSQFPKLIKLFSGSNLTIKKSGASRIFCADFAQGFTINKSIVINLGGSMTIENDSKGTVIG
jgi:hypothetical protein